MSQPCTVIVGLRSRRSAQRACGALGLAILTAVSTARTNALTPSRNPFANLVQGWDLGFMVGGGLLLLASLTMFALVRVDRDAAVRAVELAVPA